MRMSLALSIFMLLAGCSKPATDIPTTEAAPARAAEPKRLIACELVTAEEMSVIVAVPMQATRDADNATKCSYQPTAGSSMPMIELAVDIGGGEAAMVAMNMMGRMENGELNDPLHGVGDQAFVVGPESMIRRGEDLVRIMVIGTDDGMIATKQIYETASARLP